VTVQSKVVKAIEHHEMVVKFGQDVAFSTPKKEFVDAKLKICESIYGRLKFNPQL
jgi:hypothetical protein